jgi:hypothetical protein
MNERLLLPNIGLQPTAAGVIRSRRGRSRALGEQEQGIFMKFEHWLGELLGESEHEVTYLLKDETALRFLIAWSLFEAKCFDGFVKLDGLDAFACRLISESYDCATITDAARHFHQRYQDETKFQNLMYRQHSKRMSSLLQQQLGSLGPHDLVFLVALVTYRYRNNMFHGNKGVRSWLQYKTQIGLCTNVLQSFVSHAEAMRPTLQKERVA